jgi:flagellar biosynthesis/type III secretory pathway M-ring protein FliF/YscJ
MRRITVVLLAIGLMVTAAAIAVVVWSTSDDKTVAEPIETFVERVKDHEVEEIVVRGTTSTIEYRLIGQPDVTYRTNVGTNDTLRQLLEKAGVKPEDFPPIEIAE